LLVSAERLMRRSSGVRTFSIAPYVSVTFTLRKHDMRHISSCSLWLGHRGDLCDPRRLISSGIQAVLDLALEEPPVPLPRDLVYCRFPLIDGADNPPWVLRSAVATAAGLLRDKVPTLVCCGAGMSRSPAVAAAALAATGNRSLDESLAVVLESGAGDVSPGLWRDVKTLMDQRPAG
jgi:hypothetical protein